MCAVAARGSSLPLAARTMCCLKICRQEPKLNITVCRPFPFGVRNCLTALPQAVTIYIPVTRGLFMHSCLGSKPQMNNIISSFILNRGAAFTLGQSKATTSKDAPRAPPTWLFCIIVHQPPGRVLGEARVAGHDVREGHVPALGAHAWGFGRMWARALPGQALERGRSPERDSRTSGGL